MTQDISANNDKKALWSWFSKKKKKKKEKKKKKKERERERLYEVYMNNIIPST